MRLETDRLKKAFRKINLFRPQGGVKVYREISVFLDKLTIEILNNDVDQAKIIMYGILREYAIDAESAGRGFQNNVDEYMAQVGDEFATDMDLPNVPTNLPGGRRRKSRRRRRRSSRKTLRKNRRVSRKRNVSRRRRSRGRRSRRRRAIAH